MSLILTSRVNFSKLQYKSLAFVAGFKRATDEGSLPEIAQYSPYFLPLNVFTASKGSNFYILFVCLFDERILPSLLIGCVHLHF